MKTIVTLIAAFTACSVMGNEPHVNVRDAREAAEHALQEARDVAEQAMHQHFAQAGAGGMAMPGRAMRVRSGKSASRQIRTLVASPKAADPKELTQIEEDLAVMSRLLNKEVEKEVGNDANRAMGIAISSWGGETKAPEAIYLEGFGALFALNVNFPLVAPAEEKDEKKAAAAADSEWDKARVEVFGGPDQGDPNQPGVLMLGMNAQPPAYDPDKVDALKSTVLSALRNAVNIRCLKPEDYVNVAVLSYPNRFGGGDMFASHMSVTVVQQDGKTVTKTSGTSTDSSRQSTLNVRVKKADLDTFSQGKLTLDELKKKAVITVY